MQNFQKRMEMGIKKLISDLIKSEYEARGHIVSETMVNVEFQKRVTVTINTEKPFLGSEFWEFLAELGDKVEEAVRVFGYVYQDTEFFHDYCNLSYEFKVE